MPAGVRGRLRRRAPPPWMRRLRRNAQATCQRTQVLALPTAVRDQYGSASYSSSPRQTGWAVEAVGEHVTGAGSGEETDRHSRGARNFSRLQREVLRMQHARTDLLD